MDVTLNQRKKFTQISTETTNSSCDLAIPSGVCIGDWSPSKETHLKAIGRGRARR